MRINAVQYILYTFQIISIHVGANCFNGAKAITARGIPTWTKCGKHTECQDESDGFLGVQSSNPKEKHNGQPWLCKTIMTRYDKTRYSMTSSNKDCRKAAIACSTQIHCAETPTKVHAHTRSSRTACAPPPCPHIPHSISLCLSPTVSDASFLSQNLQRSLMSWAVSATARAGEISAGVSSGTYSWVPKMPWPRDQEIPTKLNKTLKFDRAKTCKSIRRFFGQWQTISIDQHRSALAWSSSWAWQSVASWTSYTSHTSHTSHTSYTSYTRGSMQPRGPGATKNFGSDVLFQFALAQCSRGRWSQQLFV